MSLTIDQAFIKQFESDVHMQYQQYGTKLRNTVRVKNGVQGVSTTFQKVGKGAASSKARHGLVPTMNVTHEPIECMLQDFYAGDWLDAMDELKVNTDERRVIASAGAYALGRKTDELIINALSQAPNTVYENNEGLTKGKILEAVEKLNELSVPDDGQRFAVVGVHQWSELLNIKEFSSSDYTGENYAYLNGSEARKWMGIIWILHNNLPFYEGGNIRECFIYHKTAIGHAIGSEIKSDISWQGERQSHFVSNSMSQGSCLIDENGIVKINCLDNAPLV
ncbi:MAG: hypothetical protein LBR35_00045 [Rickettsiales bacterium]|jgi:hypothetical protein|nr:hypothetical protein [Rickettsiales bacterium]